MPYTSQNLVYQSQELITYKWGFIVLDKENNELGMYKGNFDIVDKYTYMRILLSFNQYLYENNYRNITKFKSEDWYVFGTNASDWPGLTINIDNNSQILNLIRLYKKYDELSNAEIEKLIHQSKDNFQNGYNEYIEIKSEVEKINERINYIDTKLANSKLVSFVNDLFEGEFDIIKSNFNGDENYFDIVIGEIIVTFNIENENTISIFTIVQELVGGTNECPNNPFSKDYNAEEVSCIIKQYLYEKTGIIPNSEGIINYGCCFDEEIIGYFDVPFNNEKIVQILLVLINIFMINDTSYWDSILTRSKHHYR